MANFNEQFLFDKIVGSKTTIANTIDQMEAEPICDVKLKVDGRVLSVMLNGGDLNTDSADEFFIKISSETGAIISYPQKLQSDSKGRRDPQIRIIGSAAQIQKARFRILQSLDPHRNKVTLKLDVSHTDHSHIIGKGGKIIQSVMDSTSCHIHFPDCNRNNTQEKSNQVTIAGTCFWNVEQARQLIRHYLPLTISFQIAVNGKQVNLLDIAHPSIQLIQKKYNVVITFRYSQRNALFNSSTATALIRGSRARFEELREATRALYLYLNGSHIGFNNVVITINIDIAAQHHSFVMGRGNCNVKSINDHTGAVVSFPDIIIGSPAVQRTQNKKSVVTIKGRGIDSAFMAWLELLGYLPLILVFDLRPEQELDSRLIADLMSNQQLNILIRPKNRNSTKSILIKSQERHSTLLFDARKRILNLDEPETYFPQMPSLPECTMSRMPSGFPNFPLDPEMCHMKPEIIRAMEQYFDT
jgi:protein bicaudal C